MAEQEGSSWGGWSQPLPTAAALCMGGDGQRGGSRAVEAGEDVSAAVAF